MSDGVLNILRDQAHVQAFAIKHPDQHALSAAEFFRHLCHPSEGWDPLDASLRWHDNMNLVVAEWLAEHDPRNLRLSFDYVRLLNSLTHGGVTPAEILSCVIDDSEPRIEIVRRLNKMSQLARERGVVDSVTRLSHALRLLKALPANLTKYALIRCHYLVDLSELELEVIFRLSELSMPIEMIWPIDEHNRGMTLPVSYMADRIESRHDLENIEMTFVPTDMTAEIHLCRASDIQTQARFVAQAVAGLPSASIAIAMRVIDERATFFRDALRQHGIAIRERKGDTLIRSVAAHSVVTQLKESDVEHATLREFHLMALDILETQVPKSAQGYGMLTAKLRREHQNLVGSLGRVSKLAYLNWFKKNCAQEFLPAAVSDEACRVELLPLPEMLGREFDYVVIVDLVHGRCPQSPAAQPLFSDNDRFWLNHLMKRPILRLYEDNPLEPSSVPPRQALEPLWFLGACSAAKEGLILTTSRRDETGRDLASSEFFDDVVQRLGLDPETFEGGHTSLKLEVGDRERRFQRASLSFQRASLSFQRRLESMDPSLRWGDNARVQIDREVFRQQFGTRLGLSPERALTPTRIEGLATCPFKGYVEKILNVDTNFPAGFDMDVRSIGHLAHESLELYYKTPSDARGKMPDILAACAHKYFELASAEHRLVYRATVNWLAQTLERLVSILAKDPPVSDVTPVDFELSIGLGSELGAVPIRIGDEFIYFGGVIDRVDQGPKARVVVDYKTSTAIRTRQKIDEKELLVTHFQLPLYLRLLEHHRPSDESTALLAYLIAIRDGVPTRILDLRSRALDDESEDGLAKSLERLLLPILNGDVTPTPGDVCRTCRLKRVCRVSV